MQLWLDFLDAFTEVAAQAQETVRAAIDSLSGWEYEKDAEGGIPQF